MLKKIFLPLMIILTMVLAACSTSNQDAIDKRSAPPVVNEIADNNVAMVGKEDARLTPMEAFDKYMEKYPDTKVEEISLDTNFGSYVYKVEGYDEEKEYKLKISATDGSIVEEKIENNNDYKNDGEITKVHIEKIENLVSQALEDGEKGAKLDQWSLEIDNGTAILAVEIDLNGSDDIEYKYNVETGKLIEKDR